MNLSIITHKTRFICLLTGLCALGAMEVKAHVFDFDFLEPHFIEQEDKDAKRERQEAYEKRYNGEDLTDREVERCCEYYRDLS